MNFKNIDRRLITILLIVFVGIMGASLILPILPLYAQSHYHMSPAVITLLNASFFAAQFVAGPYLGRLSDRRGRLPVLILSQIGTAISFIMLAFAPNVAWLFAARILDGITGGNIIVAQAYITDITPREQRTQSLGYIFAVFGLGFIIGPALGGLLSAAYGLQMPYLIAAIAAILTVVLTWFTLNETLSPAQRLANHTTRNDSLRFTAILGNYPLLLILGLAFFGQFVFGLFQGTFALYSQDVLFHGYPAVTIGLGVGLLLAAVGVGQLLTQLFLLRPLLKRYGESWLVVIGTIARMIALVIFAVITTPWLGAFGSIFFAMGMGLLMPPLQSLATSAVADEMRGGVLGIYQSVANLGIIISTAIAGVIFAFHPTLPYWLGALLSLLLIAPALWLVRRTAAAKAAMPVGAD
jgi:MFS transporter, DHA1 family, tetracycline resistance protein